MGREETRSLQRALGAGTLWRRTRALARGSGTSLAANWIAVPPMTVTHWCSERSAPELIRHELRWARTIRAVSPAGFAASIVTHGVPLGLIGCVLLGFSPIGVAAFILPLAARMALATGMNARFGTSDPIWLVPLRDLLSFMVFLGALFTTRVDWRGARFRVSSAGALAQD